MSQATFSLRSALCFMPSAIWLKNKNTMGKFRFEDIEIWRVACLIGDELDDIANGLENQKRWRYAEQLRGAALSISNNIAEGSGSSSKKDFQNFLNFSRRSVFENANIVLFLNRKGVLDRATKDRLVEELRILAAKISAFSKTLGPEE